MIVGIGTDLVSITRIAAVLAAYPQRFPARVLTVAERAALPADAAARARWLAKRWAAKEAVAKAFGTGIGGQLSFQDIEIARAPSGQPLLRWHGAGLVLAQQRGIRTGHVSLSDDGDLALAFVVLEGGAG